MRVTCKDGFIQYRPQGPAELSRFLKLFGFPLKPEEDYFTHAGLIGLPRFSIQGHPYANVTAAVTFEGRHAHEVFRENGLVYSLATGLLVPAASIVSTVRLTPTQDCVLAPTPFLQPGIIISPGQKLRSYDGILDMNIQKLYLQSVEVGP